MTTTMVLDRIMPLADDENMKTALAEHLGKIGLAVAGVRGNTLVIYVQNEAALPKGSFREALRTALGAVPNFWDRFDSVSFN